MATETFVVETNQSAAEAFDRIVDLARVVEWDRGIHASTLAAGNAGEVGARYAVTVRGFDRELTTVDYELTAVDRPHTFSMIGSHPDFRAEDTITIEPNSTAAGTGCVVTYQASLVLLGDERPMTDEQLARVFTSTVEVARSGLESFLSSE